MARRRHPKTGPKPLALAQKRRNRVMVNLTDSEFAAIKLKAAPQPLATYVREKALAS